MMPFYGGSPSSKFSITSAWKAIREPNNKESWCQLIWGGFVVSRYNFITWLALMNRLPVKINLVRWRVINNFTCQLCLNSVETVEPIFFARSFSKKVWSIILQKCNVNRSIMRMEEGGKLVCEEN